MKRFWAGILCVTMGLMLLTGCGGSSSDSGSASGGSSAGKGSDDGEGVVRYTLTSTPQIDPGVGSDLGAATVLINVYDPLVMPQKTAISSLGLQKSGPYPKMARPGHSN
ncbi:MAG: hypothetical protein ACLR71_09765 [[Clostridium] scindens]